MYDITLKAVSETGTVDITDADGDPMFDREVVTEEDRKAANRLSVTLYGPGSRVHEQAEAERQNSYVALSLKRGGKFKASAEEQADIDSTFYARVTKSFNHWTLPPEDGAEQLAGFDMFKATYLRGTLGFIKAQVKTYLGDWGNFKKKPSKS